MGKSTATRQRIIGFSLLYCLVFSTCKAEVTLDGTMGSSGSLHGPDFHITEDLGQLHGANLFHSFNDFNLTSTESATFSGNAAITNVISRVTGGTASSIDGAINSTINGANVFFINPYGVVFGANASVNVSGSFYVSTADYLALSDGGRFDARTPANTVLTSAAPAAFGFLSANPAGITLDGTQLDTPGQEFALVGGGIEIIGRVDSLLREKADHNIYAGDGRIDLVAVAAASEVAITADGLNADAVSSFGDITLRDGALVTASGDPGGTIYIRGGNLTIQDSLIINGNIGTSDHTGRAIDIELQGDLIIEHTFITRRPLGFRAEGGIEAPVNNVNGTTGDGGDIHIVARDITLQGNPDVNIFGRENWLKGSVANISAQGYLITGGANGGNIDIVSDTLNLFENSYISTQSTFDTNAGDISITANAINLLGITGYTRIRTDSIVGIARGLPPITGNAGNITVNAHDIKIQGGTNGMTSRYEQGRGDANAGNITITANSLQVLDGAVIDSGRGGESGNGGTITIAANDVLVQGVDANNQAAIIRASISNNYATDVSGGDVNISTNTLTLTDDGRVENINATSGAAGDINITAANIDISRGGLIITGPIYPTEAPLGTAGDINIVADSIRIHTADATGGSVYNGPVDPRFPSDNNPTGIVSAAYPTAQLGAGDINITTGTLDILDGGEINATTWSSSNGGNITINATDITLAGSNAERNVASRIISASDVAPDDYIGSFAGGNGGDINITTQTLALTDQAQITAYSNSTGAAGNITINAGNNVLLNDSAISTNATQSTNGGNIILNAVNMLYLTDSQINASVTGAIGNGGNISIDPIVVILNHSSISANSVGGTGGNISIVAQNFIASPDSSVTASSQTGIDGNVVVTAPDRDLGGELETVPEPAPDAARYFRNDCVAVGGGYSSFTLVKSKVVPRAGKHMLSSSYLAASDANDVSSHAKAASMDTGKPLLVLARHGTDCLGKRI